MPLSRYQVRNEYSLADPELYRAADKDDPEALLEGVAMAGLVGVLRQLGDLAEFAAEIFHDLHEEVMVTAARGHGLLVRVQQLESEFPSIENAFLSQTGHSAFFSNSGIDWHPNMQTEQNLITKGDLPRFVMDSYEECRGPPRLFLLDKFDVAGAGACLKRYTDPSFYKMEASSFEMAGAESVKDKKLRKTKKKGSRWKNRDTPEVLQSSHVKLHQLFLEERIHNGPSEPARRVKLKKRPNKFPFDSEGGKTYMEKLLKTQSEDKLVHEVPIGSAPLRLSSENSGGSAIEILEISTVGSTLGSVRQNRSPIVSPSVDKTVSRQLTDGLSENLAERQMSELPTSNLSLEAGSMSFGFQEDVHEKHVAVDGEIKTDSIGDGYRSDDAASETDNFVDALTTMESEVDADTEFRTKTDPSVLNVEKQETYSDPQADQPQSQFSDSQSIGHSSASDEGITSIRKEITSSSCSDTTSISADNISIGGVGSPQAFGFTEIPFRPRVSSNQVSVTDKVSVTKHPEHEISDGNSIEVSEIASHRPATDPTLPVDQGAISIEFTSIEADPNEVFSDSENLNSPRKTEERQIDMENTLASTSKLSDVPSPATTDNSFSPSFTRNSEGEVGNEDPNACSSPVIHHPEVSETTICTSANSFSSVCQAEYAEDNGTTGLDSKCSSPCSLSSHVEEQPVHPSLEELDVCDRDVKPHEVTSSDAVIAAEEKADSPHVSSLPEGQLKEIGNGILARESDSTEAGLSYFHKDGTELEERETESDNSEIKVAAAAVGAPCDVVRNGDNDLSTSEDELALEERETVSVGSETKLVKAAVSVPDKIDENEDNDLGNDGELEEREAEPEVVTAAVPATVEVGKNEDNGLSTVDEPHQNGLVINELRIIQNSNQSSEKEEDQLSVLSGELDSVPCDTVSFDHTNMQLLDGKRISSLATRGDVNQNDIGKPSANLKIVQNESHMTLEEPDQNGLQPVVSPDLDSQMGDDVASDHSKVQWLDDAPESSMSEKSLHFDVATAVSSSSKCIEQDLEPESPYQDDQVDKFEVTSSISSLLPPLEGNEEQPLDQPSRQPLPASGPNSQSASQSEGVNSQNNVDQQYDDTHVDLSSVNLASQRLEQEEGLQDEQRDMGPITAVVPAHGSAHLEELQSSSESCSVPAPEGPSVLALPQSSKHELGLSDQVQYPSTPVLSGFGMLPQLAPINLEEMPPLPPLPPMQWRMGKLQNASSTPKTYGGQHGVDHFPPSIPSNAEEPQIASYPSLDGHRNPSNPVMVLPDTENKESQRGYEDLEGETVGSSQMLSTDAHLDTEERDKSSMPSEVKAVKLAESVVSKPVLESEQYQNVAMTSGREIFWPSSTSSFPPVDEERPNGIRPMKIQRPRSPLIDAVAAHDKSKLRRVSELAKPQMPKEEERDTLLEQIRAKSFNLKPAVQTRPNIQQGPKTNLRVAAILEKANAIRQAFAGSDDDDEDSWSDS